MDRLDTAIVAPLISRVAILARIDVLERGIAAGLLRGVTSAAEYKAINNIMAEQHAEARAFAEPHGYP